MYDGAVRAITYVGGGYIGDDQKGTTRDGYIHGADWPPTLLSIAGIDLNKVDNDLQKKLGATKNIGVDGVDSTDGKKHLVSKHKTPKQHKHSHKKGNKIIGSQLASFDGIDLSKWLLFGDESDNTRNNVGLSVNTINSGYDTAIVFTSEVTGHRYKFMDLGSPPPHGDWCDWCHNEHSGQVHRCRINANLTETKYLYDLTLDFNETTNLKTDDKTIGNINLKSKSLATTNNMTTVINTANVNLFEYYMNQNGDNVQIQNMSDYGRKFVLIDDIDGKSVKADVSSVLWDEGYVLAEGFREDEYFNDYLECQYTMYTQWGDPTNLGGAYGPFLDFDLYKDFFEADCGRFVTSPPLYDLYTTRYNSGD